MGNGLQEVGWKKLHVKSLDTSLCVRGVNEESDAVGLLYGKLVALTSGEEGEM